jgi:hypothetical protein
MATAIATLQTSLGYHLGLTISSTSRWSSDQTAALLNQALRKIVAELYAAKCWKLLNVLEEEAEYTLDGSSSYSVYTAIGSSTNYQGFIGGRIGTARVREATIEEEYKTQTGGEYEPTALDPWIIFYDYDSAEGHGSLPVFRIKPSALTGTFYFRYLKVSPTMVSTTVLCPLPVECDDAIVFLAAAYCWSGDRNSGEFSRFHQLYKSEMAALIGKYEQPVWYDAYYESEV